MSCVQSAVTQTNDDVFDEDADDMSIAQKEWKSAMEKRVKEGYREGVEAGKELTLQQGFNQGFEEAAKMVITCGKLKGKVSVCRVRAPKKPADSRKRKREMILLAVKQDIIRKHEKGMRVVDLAREYGKGTSTIATILKDKERIMGRETAKGVTILTKNRPAIMDEVEKLLLPWIHEKERAGDTVTSAVVCAKARALHADLIAQQPGTSHEEFKASHGWFERFKMRSGIRSVVRHREAASSDLAVVEEFATEFLETVTSEGYLTEPFFSCDETGLFSKRMPRRTFIPQEETKMPGPKPMKDRLTLHFCANVRGDLKLKPLQEQEQQGVQPDTPEEQEEKPRLWPSSSYNRACEEQQEMQPGTPEEKEEKPRHWPSSSYNKACEEQQGVQPGTPEEKEEKPRQWPLSSYNRACEEQQGVQPGTPEEKEEKPRQWPLFSYNRACEEQQVVQPGSPEEQEEEPRQWPSSSYNRACDLWGELQVFVNDLSEDQAAALEAVEHFDNVVVAPWRAVLRRRQRQQTIDRLVVEQARQEEEPCSSSQLSPSASSSKK